MYLGSLDPENVNIMSLIPTKIIRSAFRHAPGACLWITVLIFLSISPVYGADTEYTSDSVKNDYDANTGPDYGQVFPSLTVLEIHITMTPEDYAVMQADLETNFSQNPMMSPPEPGFQKSDQLMNGPPDMSMGPMIPVMDDSNPIYVPASVTFNGTSFDHVGIRYKGFNSLHGAVDQGSGKISLKLDMDHYEDEYPETKNQNHFGFGELNLQSNFLDTSLLREKVVPEIFRSAGVPAPHTAFYRVYLDYGDGEQYMGLYTLIEEVEDTVIQTQFSNSTGNLYKPEQIGSTFAEGTMNLSQFNKKTNKKEDDYSDVEAIYAALHDSDRKKDPEAWRSNLESVLNVDEFLRWLATNTVIQNSDTYGLNNRNYYLYNNPDTQTISWIPWDNNYALMEQIPDQIKAGKPDFLMANEDRTINNSINGSENSVNFPIRTPPEMQMQVNGSGMQNSRQPPMPMGQIGPALSLSLEEVNENWPLIQYLIDDPVYKARYHDLLKEVVTGAFNPETISDTYQTYHDLIKPYVVGEYGEQEGYTFTNGTAFESSLDELKSHAESRYNAVMDYLETVEG